MSNMDNCIRCYSKDKTETRAALLLDDDPLCIFCAREDGYSDEEIAAAMAAFAEARKPKTMAVAADSCAMASRPNGENAVRTGHPQRPAAESAAEDCATCSSTVQPAEQAEDDSPRWSEAEPGVDGKKEGKPRRGGRKADTPMATCKLDGCKEAARIQGLCKKHYQREWYAKKHGNAAAAAETPKASLVRENPRKWHKNGKTRAGGAKPAAGAAVTTISITEDRLDHFLTHVLTLEEKSEIVSAYFSGR